jgi:hypothetical protein
MTDLTELLDRASDLDHTPMPVDDDLTRARAALRRQRRTRGLVGSVGVIALVAAGVAGTTVLDRDSDADTVVTEEQPGDGIQLVAARAEGGPYTFGKLPRGWEVQGTTPSAVTIAPADAKNTNSNSFLGKLVIMYDQNPPSGDVTTVGGRDFFIRGDSDHTTIMVSTRAGEPEGLVYVQYPDSAGWDEETMIELLDAVRVNDSAQPGIG